MGMLPLLPLLLLLLVHCIVQLPTTLRMAHKCTTEEPHTRYFCNCTSSSPQGRF
jgi:hypothetical protein